MSPQATGFLHQSTIAAASVRIGDRGEHTMQELAQRLNGMCDEQPFQTGWYLKNLKTGEEVDRDGHVIVPSASTRKIAILATALKQIHEGKLSLDQPVEIRAKYQNNNSGVFQHFTPGFTITLR